MFGFGWMEKLPWTRAARTARARKEVEYVLERSAVLARAVENQLRHKQAMEDVERERQASRRAAAARREEDELRQARSRIVAQMQIQRSGVRKAAPPTVRRDEPVASTAASEPAPHDWHMQPIASTPALADHACRSSHDGGGSSYGSCDSGSSDSGGGGGGE